MPELGETTLLARPLTACCGRPVPEAGQDHWPCCEEHGCCDGEPHDA